MQNKVFVLDTNKVPQAPVHARRIMMGVSTKEQIENRSAGVMGITIEEYRARQANSEKRCSKCRTWKKKSEFPLDRSRKDGSGARCHQCNNVERASRYADLKASTINKPVKPDSSIKRSKPVKRTAQRKPVAPVMTKEQIVTLRHKEKAAIAYVGLIAYIEEKRFRRIVVQG